MTESQTTGVSGKKTQGCGVTQERPKSYPEEIPQHGSLGIDWAGFSTFRPEDYDFDTARSMNAAKAYADRTGGQLYTEIVRRGKVLYARGFRFERTGGHVVARLHGVEPDNGEPPKDSDDMDKYTDMPEPKALVTLSWEDIHAQAQTETWDRWGRSPTRDEILEIFGDLDACDFDLEHGTFWETIRYAVQNYYDNLPDEEDE